MESSMGMGVGATADPCGSISKILGPMFSGKSTELMRRVERCTRAGMDVALITHEKDNRFSDAPAICTHDKKSVDAIAASSLGSDVVSDAVKDAEVVAVDEGQFFPDLVEMCEKWADAGKIVIVAALDLTFERKPFKVVRNLGAEYITKLTAVCQEPGCRRDASFSNRLTSDKGEILVGGAEEYEALCRMCFNKKN